MKYNVKLTKVGSIGISAMMHGYLAFDEAGKLLVPFRTWRNTNTKKAAEILSEQFNFNIPMRWSIAHLFQCILCEEEHLNKISFMTTLSGYVHWKLTGEKIVGIGEASGMFPIDFSKLNYDYKKVKIFNRISKKAGFNKDILEILPNILLAGNIAGHLSERGRYLLDPTGNLEAGIPFCPPEGDAGTGMVSTNTLKANTGNISAGTSIFSIISLGKELSKPYKEIDIASSPDGSPIAMIHCNNGTSDFDSWVQIIMELFDEFNINIDKSDVYSTLYSTIKNSDDDCGKIMNINYVSGEHITNMPTGRPMVIRTSESNFTLSNLVCANIFSTLTTLRMGFDILTKEEEIVINELLGHGGMFKAGEISQIIISSALNTPLSVMETASEGGAWGIAILAAYCLNNSDETLEEFLNNKVFNLSQKSKVFPCNRTRINFENFLKRYKNTLPIVSLAIEKL